MLSYSDYDDICPKFIVREAKILKEGASILVMCERADAKWSVVGIEINQKNYFIHFILNTCPSRDTAYNAFTSKNAHTDFGSEAYSHAHAA